LERLFNPQPPLETLPRRARTFFADAPKSPLVYLDAVAVVGAGAAVAWLLETALGTTRLTVIFLASVILVAMRLGAHAGLVAAAAAAIYVNFFLREPRFTLGRLSAEEVVNLAVFTAVALGIGGLAGRARDEGERVKEREQTTNLLFQASREMSSTADEVELRQRLADWARRAVGGDVFVVSADGLQASERPEQPPPAAWQAELRERLTAGGWEGVLSRHGWSARMLPSEQSAGAVLWRAPPSKFDEENARLIEVLANLASAAIARAKISNLMAEAAALKAGERFVTTLLSSVSHDFRTPITAILASATGLQNYGARFDEAVRGDLLDTIVEESQRLEGYVANILNLTQLEAGALTPHLSPASLDQIVDCAWRRARPPPGQTVTIGGMEGVKVLADPVLLEQTLVNVLENALRFTPPGEDIEIVAQRSGAEVALMISDHGPGVKEGDIARLFDKFFRVRGANPQTGKGLGLFIARGFIEAMGGRIAAGRRADGGSGLLMWISLPAAP
jgi:K+-sensing histidine kinase KdpD